MEVSSQHHAPAAVPQYVLNKKLGGPLGQSECFGEKKNLLSMLEFEPLTVRPVA
jgi:hypothetical protein